MSWLEKDFRKKSNIVKTSRKSGLSLRGVLGLNVTSCEQVSFTMLN